jgi:hypothetical protein
MFEQAVLTVEDSVHFGQAKAVLEQVFAPGNIAGYLGRLRSSKLRVRDFEGALGRGLLGKEIAQAYELLGQSDRGQVRELYLSLVERVAPELRAKFLGLYAYY